MRNIVIKYVVDDSQLSKARESSVRAQKATDDLRKSTQSYSKDVKQAGTDGQKSFNQISTAIKSISLVLVAKELLDFTKQVIAVRGEFQKFEAVLTNTLGSRSAALIALGRINEFAKSTPFGVKELTDNFIKLANRGIQPTVQQMRAIADLSATLGKEFSQVVEAILDINNPERWKEIGIKAETAGNKVKLTFRGVTEEVDRTVEGVTGAVVALGKLNGVAGSTEAISRTLAGQTSNLNDAWEQLLNTIGKGNEGVLFKAVGLLSQALEKANELLKSPEQRFEEASSKTLSAEVEAFEKLAIAMGSSTKAEQAFLSKREERLESISRRQRELLNLTTVTPEGESARLKELARLRDLFDIYNVELPKAITETIKKLEEKKRIDDAAAQAAKKAADAARNTELSDRRRGTHPLKDLLTVNSKTGEEFLENFKIIIGDTQRIQGPVELKVKPTVPMDEWDQFEIHWKDNWRNLLTDGLGILGDFLVGSQQAEIESFNSRINNLRNFYDEQIHLAGDNERRKKELRIKADRDIADLERQRADREKRAAQAGILVNTALGIIKAYATAVTVYDGAIQAALVAAQGAAQYAIANRTRYYAKGEIDIKGGTPGKDSIPAVLMPGESIMTTKQTKEAFGILTDIRNGKLNDRVLKQIVSNGGSAALDDSRIVNILQKIESKRSPDLVRQGRQIYEVYKDREGNKRFVRSKSM